MSSLPPALLARLKKRGIIKDAPSTETSETSANSSKLTNKPTKLKKIQKKVHEAVGCPNKHNLTHFCNEYCDQKFGLGVEQPPIETQKIYEKLVSKYPLTDDWVEVWEPGVARFYFWNTNTDEVSWYPPQHPKAKLTLSAIRLKAGEKKTDVAPKKTVEEELLPSSSTVKNSTSSNEASDLDGKEFNDSEENEESDEAESNEEDDSDSNDSIDEKLESVFN